MAEKIEYVVDINTKPAESAVSDLKKDVKGMGDNVVDQNKKASQSFSTMPEPIGRAKKAVLALNAGLKALLANPIVLLITAIVAALTLMVKAFTSTKEGGEKVQQLLAGFNATLDVLRDRVLKVTQAFKLLFSGEFKKAADAFKESVSGIVDEIKEEARAAVDLKDRLQAVADAERNLTVERAKQNKEIAKARLIAMDESKSLEERMNAVRRAAALEEELAQKEIKLAREKAAAIEAQNAMSDSSAADLDAAAAARARVFQLETDSLNKRKRLETELEALRNEHLAKQKERQKQLEEAEKARLEALKQRHEFEKKMLEDEIKTNEENVNEYFDQQKLQAIRTIENEQELADALEQIELDRLARLIQEREDYGQKTTDLELKQAAKQRDIQKKANQEELENERMLQQKKEALIASGFAAIQSLVGADTKWGKAIAITSAIIDTYKGANKALGAGGPLGIPTAAVIVAQGLANVKNILGQKIENAPSGGSSGGSSGSASIPSIGPSVGIVNAQIDSSTQIADSLNNLLNKPPKAYVVGQNVTTQQSLDRHIDQNATIGG